MNPVDTAPLITQVANAGPLAAFMMLVILALFAVCIYLYKDSRSERKENTDALGTINITLAAIKEVLNVLSIRKD